MDDNYCNHQKSSCGNFLSCFQTRSRRCNSDTETCRRCSGRKNFRDRTASTNIPPRSPLGQIHTMAITTYTPSQSKKCLPNVPAVTLTEEIAKKQRCISDPSAPSPGLVLFNSEDHSDIVFLVGQKPDQWRFPGHSFILAPASPVFESLITRSKLPPTYSEVVQLQNQPNTISQINEELSTAVVPTIPTERVLQIEVLDTPPDVFENVLSFVYTNSIPYLSVSSALRLMQAANHYQVSALCATCLAFLLDNVSKENVLEILNHFHQHRRQPRIPSEGNNSPQVDELCTNLQNEVLLQCLCIIDDHAESILKAEGFENLNQDTMSDLLNRDTLRVRSELTVFDAAMRWACQECKRRQLELVPENKRDSLGKTLYSVRYLAMSPQEFNRGPVAAGILPDEEKEALLSRLNGNFSSPLPGNLQGRKMDYRRPFPKIHGNSGAVPKTNSRRPLGRSASFTSGSTSPLSNASDRRLRRKNSSVDGKKNSASKKFLQGLEDIAICFIQLLD